ncbi:phosphomevalonate kinase [Myotisia sp. PD_48]|nr:phosphomevalonate kinase [Myotisia sp. PD_48]
MPHHPPTETAISAPGKVLLAGGYLVLDRDYTGTVFALNARIHVVVQQLRQEKGSKQSIKLESSAHATENGHVNGFEGPNGHTNGISHVNGKQEQENGVQLEETITVRSPQFINAVWEYKLQRTADRGGVKVQQTNDGPRNPFVETSLSYALTYISYVSASRSFGSLSITIIADNDYYSETAATYVPLENPGGFKNFGVRLQDAHKTGLGSSAALVTALVSALVIHRTVHPEELAGFRGKLHNLAQAAHCAAQGKVGSGFDVAAAVYGSCYYRRFSPGVLSNLGDAGSPKFEERLFSVVEDVELETPWDSECIDIGSKLPRGMEMVLCDVDCGSETPGMVKKLLQWRDDNREEADIIWGNLQLNNEKLRLELQKQSTGLVGNFSEIRNLLMRSRLWLKTMTKKSGVPVEPMVQSELLDALCNVEGVIGGVVPGAGGYDAVVLLIEDNLAVVESLSAFVKDWRSTVEDDFGGKIERVRLLGVGYGADGLRNEIPVRYCNWT